MTRTLLEQQRRAGRWLLAVELNLGECCRALAPALHVSARTDHPSAVLRASAQLFGRCHERR